MCLFIIWCIWRRLADTMLQRDMLSYFILLYICSYRLVCVYMYRYINLSCPNSFIHRSEVFKDFLLFLLWLYMYHTAFETEFAPWIASENFIDLDHDHLSDRPACHRTRPAAPGPLSQYQVCHRQVVLNHSPQRGKFTFEHYQHRKGL